MATRTGMELHGCDGYAITINDGAANDRSMAATKPIHWGRRRRALRRRGNDVVYASTRDGSDAISFGTASPTPNSGFAIEQRHGHLEDRSEPDRDRPRLVRIGHRPRDPDRGRRWLYVERQRAQAPVLPIASFTPTSLRWNLDPIGSIPRGAAICWCHVVFVT
jgi:hypothetical protein